MKALTPAGDPAVFFRELSRAAHRILFLDFDGTLAPFREERDQAAPYPGVPEILDAIAENAATRIVFITGRAIADIRPLLRLRKTPEIWGSHGREHLDASGRHTRAELPGDVSDALGKAREWAHSMGLADYFEEKAGCVALHWRPFPAGKAARIREEALGVFGGLAAQGRTQLHEFDGGLELQAPGHDKGWAIRQVLRGETGDARCAFLGDDYTDEDGFRSLKGQGLSVLVRRDFRETAADLWIRPPEELLSFLEGWRDACNSRQNIS